MTSNSTKTGFKRYFYNTSWLLSALGIQMALSIVVGVYVANYLGPDNFGIYNYVISFVALFTPFASLGLQNIVVKALNESPDREDEIVGTAFFMKSISGAIACLAVLLVAFFTQDDETRLFFLAIAGVQIFLRAWDVISFYHQSAVTSKYASIAQLTQLFISAGLKVALVYFEWPLKYFIYLLVFDAIMLAIGFAASYRHVGQRVKKWKWNSQRAKSLLSDSWP